MLDKGKKGKQCFRKSAIQKTEDQQKCVQRARGKNGERE